MGLGTGATAAIIGGIGAAGSVASSAISANAAGNAAGQAQSADQQAAATLLGAGQQASTLQGTATSTGTQEVLGAGSTANNNLAALGLFNNPNSAPYTPAQSTFTPFVAPNPQDIASNPNYQFINQQGQDAIQSSAAAKGLLQSGGTLKDLASFTQGNATNFVNTAYNQALSTNQQNNYGSLAVNQANNQTNLAANQNQYQQALQQYLTQYGLVNQANSNLIGANTTAAQLGLQGANSQASSILTGAGGNANYTAQGGQAQAAGTAGTGNAWAGAVNGVAGAGQYYASGYPYSGSTITPNSFSASNPNFVSYSTTGQNLLQYAPPAATPTDYSTGLY